MGSKHRNAAKGKRVSGKTADWERFERLVARVEELLAPQGAIVAWKEPLKTITGDWVTPDVTIRVPSGPRSLLVLMECRKRSQVSDQRWIQELVGKRQATGADRVVAVSNKRVSGPALRFAAFANVEVLMLADARAEDIPPLLQTFWMERVNIQWRNEIGLLFKEQPRYPPNVVELLREHFERGEAVLIRMGENEDWRSSADILAEVDKTRPHVDVPPGQDPPVHVESIRPEPGEQMEMLFMDTQYGLAGMEIRFEPIVNRVPHEVSARAQYGRIQGPPGFFATEHEMPGGRDDDTVVAVTDAQGSWLSFNLPRYVIEAMAEYRASHPETESDV